MICRSFAPVFDPAARVLIVGSMPSVKSLAQAQYYAHPRNAFWPMLYDYFGEPITDDYERRIDFARAHRIALWDSAAVCVRAGSLDTAMKQIQLNDFAALLAACPELRAVACNGARSYALFMQSACAQRLPVLALPSTSPANAAMDYAAKAARWAEAFALTREG